jgi:hypothetical protein
MEQQETTDRNDTGQRVKPPEQEMVAPEKFPHALGLAPFSSLLHRPG